MLALCFFYCIPFAKFMYFAISPVLIVFCMFMFKRGIYTARPKLRQWALVLIFFALVKIFVFDVRELGRDLLCTVHEQLSEVGCSPNGLRGLQLASLLLLVASSLLLFQLHRTYMNVKQVTALKPDDVHLRLWANMSLLSLIGMVVWQCAPWVASLTIGRTPAIFNAVPWQALAIFNLCLLVYGFWKSESCNWNYEVKNKQRMAHLNQTWTPRDTLWMCVFVYLVTLALAYVAHDILAPPANLAAVQQQAQQQIEQKMLRQQHLDQLEEQQRQQQLQQQQQLQLQQLELQKMQMQQQAQ